jgi:hypothetical protein
LPEEILLHVKNGENICVPAIFVFVRIMLRYFITKKRKNAPQNAGGRLREWNRNVMRKKGVFKSERT